MRDRKPIKWFDNDKSYTFFNRDGRPYIIGTSQASASLESKASGTVVETEVNATDAITTKKRK